MWSERVNNGRDLVSSFRKSDVEGTVEGVKAVLQIHETSPIGGFAGEFAAAGVTPAWREDYEIVIFAAREAAPTGRIARSRCPSAAIWPGKSKRKQPITVYSTRLNNRAGAPTRKS